MTGRTNITAHAALSGDISSYPTQLYLSRDVVEALKSNYHKVCYPSINIDF